MVSAQSSAYERVCNDVKNVHSINDDTLHLLKGLLGPRENPATGKRAAGRPTIKSAPKRPPTVSKPARNTVEKSKNAPTFKIHDEVALDFDVLEVKQRKKLATLVFNATLKYLGQATKAQQSSRECAPAPSTKAAKSAQKEPQSKPSVRSKAAADPHIARPETSNVLLNTKCASVALDCLRVLEEESHAPDFVDDSLENGGLIVLDRTITLELLESAEYQARRIHEQYWKRRKEQRTFRSVYDSIRLGLEDNKAHLKFATSFQSQLLRLAILKGYSAAVPGFSACFEPSAEGSPTWMCQRGLLDGFTETEACGTQLRTLSLAMSRLHTVIEESCPHNLRGETMDLAIMALQTKCLSWKYLNHQPDFPRDLWSPLSRVIKKACEAVEDKTVMRSKAKERIKSLEDVLGELGFTSTPPSALQNYCGKTDKSQSQDSDLQKPESSGQPNALTQLLSDSSAQLNHVETNISVTLATLQKCTEVLNADVGASPIRADLLIAMTRIRKSAVTLLINLQTESRKHQNYEESMATALRSLFAMVGFCARAVENTENRGDGEERGMLLAHAKTIELVMQQDSIPLTKSKLLEDEMHQSLRDCATLAIALRPKINTSGLSEGVRAFLEGATVRISNLLWKRYLWYTNQGRDGTVRAHLLSCAIEMMQNGSTAQRVAAFIGLKHDRLARLYLEDKSFSKAQSCLESAIRCHIEHAKLNDESNMDLKTSGEGLYAGLASEVLDGSLKSYLELTVDHNVPNSHGKWYFDDPEQDDFTRAVLLQKQILFAVRQNASIKVLQLSGVLQLWDQLCSGDEHLIHRMNYLSQLLEVLAKHKGIVAAALLNGLGIVAYVNSHSLDKGPQVTPQLYTVSAQLSLATSRMNESMLAMYSAMLPAIMQQIGTRPMPAATSQTKLLTKVLKAMADLAGMYGLSIIHLSMAESLLVLCKVMSPKASEDSEEFTMLTLEVARLKLELDDTVGAGKTLACMRPGPASLNSMSVPWSLTHAEYYLAIGNFEKANQTMLAAVQYSGATDGVILPGRKLERELQTCHAALLASRLAQQHGNLLLATKFARQAVKISSSVWSSFEPKLRASADIVSNGNESSLSSLTHDMSNLTMSEVVVQETGTSYDGARYWKLIHHHRSALRNAAETSSHNGLYQDAVYFAQQASKMTAWTGSVALRDSVNSDLALLYANASENEKASRLLKHNMIASQDSLEAYHTLLNYAETLARLGDASSINVHLQRARLGLTAEPSTQIVASKDVSKPPPKSKHVKASTKRPPKAAAKAKASSPPPACRQKQESITKKGLLARLNAFEYTLKSPSGQAQIQGVSPQSITDLMPVELLSQAVAFIAQALGLFATDPSNNTLCETTLAMPVQYRHVRKSGQMSLLLDQSPTKLPKSMADSSSGSEILIQAYDCLRSIDISRIPFLSSAKVELLHKALSQVMLLSTAACKPLNYTPLNVVLQSLRPKDVARLREQYAIITERETATAEQVHRWPIVEKTPEHEEDFAEVVRNLPESWTIVSIGLTHDDKELLLSRIVSASSPFLMRVPLGHPGVDDDEPCEFTLEYAKEELRDIINKANETCHDSRGQGDKQTRNAWYTEREHLDKRLELLLANIESIWLGGFRGLLTPANTDQELLARFAESLSQALDKYLPSRRKKSKSPKVDLHAHVLELFTSITFDDGNIDFEDSITDLLYFVVDILQFNGELNAFDEIDFDALLLDTTDALRGYHTAHTSTSTRHTILIIDKELQAFPWESLPCLRGHPVSRMPSLGAIADRLKHIPPTTSTYPTPSTSGAYILNPSSDLPTTEATFTPLLRQLHPNFTPLINTAPTEPQFSSLLTTSSILLYFGHGAGTQYLRPRTIRALPQCAVTWLMGCSSAKLHECGIYESYGTPNAYMHAGSPALVGTLWDVTDRDVDRFAVKALGAWGLLDLEGVEEKFWGPGARKRGKVGGDGDAGGKGKGKGKGKVKEGSGSSGERSDRKGKTGRKGKVPLDQAVAEARDACNLRYLNGAAPVVYGVPVSLV